MPNELTPAPCEKYRQYHVPYTEENQISITEGLEARRRNDEGVERGELTKVARGYMDKTDGFIIDPVIGAHLMIAKEQAQAQFKGWPAIPEDAEVSLRFPGIDPVGKYSILEMKFAQREAKVKAALQSRPPEVQAYVNQILTDRTRPAGGQLFAKHDNLRLMSRTHRELTRAAKLCHDADGSLQLEIYARSLETDTAVEQYDKLMQGIEYAAGVKEGPVPEEIRSFYQDHLQRPLDMSIVNTAQTARYQPEKLEIEFENLDHKVLQAAFSDPKNWGRRPPADLATAEQQVPAQVIDGMISPYARATADRAISPLFAAVEKKTTGDINRGDYIIVDGQTVRERMRREYVSEHGSAGGFANYYDKNVQAKTSEYVAGALMAGKRVEMFVPDEYGRISEKPLQVTKTGYEPSPDRKITLNAWERFWGKRGFYKEKVAQAAEYQRIVDARQRVAALNAVQKLDMLDGVKQPTKQQYFSQWVKENGPLPKAHIHSYSTGRSALSTMAICRMVMDGHKVEDIYDPAKLQAEKQKIGKEVMTVFSNPDKAAVDKWAGEVLFNGQRLISEQVNQAAQRMDLTNEKTILSAEARPFVAAMQTAFDASQEDTHCPKEFQAAAERYAARVGKAGQGKEIALGVSEGVNTVGLLFSFIRSGQKVACSMANGDVHQLEHTDYYSLFRSEALRGEFARRQSAEPGKSFCRLAKIAEMRGISGMPQGKAYEAIVQGATATEAARRETGRAFLSGEYQKRMHCTPGKFEASLTVDAPSKTASKQARHLEDLAAAAKKNAAPKPTGKAK